MDFLGTTTPASLLASVTTGVQSTGNQIWPLLVIVGVPLAFVIAGYIISLIRKGVGSRK
jgi:hypothetical protein